MTTFAFYFISYFLCAHGALTLRNKRKGSFRPIRFPETVRQMITPRIITGVNLFFASCDVITGMESVIDSFHQYIAYAPYTGIFKKLPRCVCPAYKK